IKLLLIVWDQCLRRANRVRGGIQAMTDCRAFALVALLVAIPALEASAQFGGMPGLPRAAPGGGFCAPPPAARPTIPPACARLLAMREEAQKQAGAIQAAGDRKATPAEACRLFRVFLNTESRMIRGIEENSAVCGVPPEVPKQMKVGHAKTQQV